jgi:hypothetical protein
MKLLLSFLIALSLCVQAHADAGGCVIYHATYVLKNGSSVTAFLPMGGLSDYAYLDDQTHRNKYCTDLEFERLIYQVFSNQRRQSELEVYKNVYKVKYGKSAAQPGPAPVRCMFSDSASIVSISLDSIRYTVFLGAENADMDYPAVNLQVVDDRTSRIMQDSDVLHYTYLSHDPVPETPGGDDFYIFDYYLALNYNKNISRPQLKAEMERIAPEIFALELKYLEEKKMRGEKFYREKERVAKGITDRLRQKGIVLVRVVEVD